MHTRNVKIQDSALRVFNAQYGGGYYSEQGAIELAQEHDWTGFAFILGADGSPIPWQDASDVSYGHFCTFAVDKVNWEIITEELGKTGRKGIEFYEGCAEYEGKIAYDYGNIGIRNKVAGFERALSGYHVLDDMRLSELEYENALKSLESCWNLPDRENILSEVMEALHDAGYGDCPDCESWDVEGVLDTMGWRECAGSVCSDLIETSIEGAVCHECAVYESVNPKCDHAFLLVDTAKHNDRFITEAEMHEADKACEDCYGELYPYGRD